MSGNSFAFPPPPPPPPQAANTQHTSAGNTFSGGRGDKRWERGSRVRGRGNIYRGSRGGNQQYGANYAVNNENPYGGGSYPLPSYPPAQQPQYPPDLHNTYRNSPPTYPPITSQPVSQQTDQRYHTAHPNAQPQTAPYLYTSPVYYPQAQQHDPYSAQPPTPHLGHRYASPPLAMGPPIRLGFGDPQSTDQRPNSYTYYDRGNHPGPNHRLPDSIPSYQEGSSYGSRGSPHQSSNWQGRGRGRGRGYGRFSRRGNSDAASTSNALSHKTQVAPAVPSFSNPLPLKPPIPQLEDKKPSKKKKRRVNQLGLTPKDQEHISSSEEEDADEEVKLATAVSTAGTAGKELKFTYKGRTSTLQSSSDIASWIEERKKRFPTAARRVENNARLQQLRHEREEARQKQEERRQALKDERLLQRQLKTLERDKQAAAEKAKAKVEKLRRKLAKEERRAAKAEAKSFKRSAPMKAEEDSRREIKRRRRQSDLNTENVQDHFEGNIDSPDDGKKPDPTEIARSGSMARENYGPVDDSQATERIKEEEPSSLITGPLTPTSQPALPENEAEPGSRKEANLSGNPVDPGQPPGPAESTKAHDACTLAPEEVTRNVCSTASSDMSVSSDDTLSGGGDEEETSSSGSSSDSDSINGGPEIAISRRPEPRKIPPPKRNAKQDKAICRDFLRTGRCRRGKRCRWRHALPDRGQRKTEEGVLARPERKSLHQRLLEQQEENERAEKKRLEREIQGTMDDTQVAAV